jgi:hypothetical protein
MSCTQFVPICITLCYDTRTVPKVSLLAFIYAETGQNWTNILYCKFIILLKLLHATCPTHYEVLPPFCVPAVTGTDRSPFGFIVCSAADSWRAWRCAILSMAQYCAETRSDTE